VIPDRADGVQISMQRCSKLSVALPSGHSEMLSILVGGLEHDFYFSIYWGCHDPLIPIDEVHDFSEG